MVASVTAMKKLRTVAWLKFLHEMQNQNLN